MELESVKAGEMLQLARSFRARAAEAEDEIYHSMMLRTAQELEQHAELIARRDGCEIVLIDEDGDEDD